MKQTYTIALFLILIIVVLGLAGNSDYDEAIRQEQDYCARVKDNIHTDYDNLKSVCEERYWNNNN